MYVWIYVCMYVYLWVFAVIIHSSIPQHPLSTRTLLCAAEEEMTNLCCLPSYSITEQGPMGSWAQKPFCFAHFFFLGKGPHSATIAFPEFQGTGSDSCWSGKEGGAKTREEQSKNSSRALGQDPGSLSRDTHNDGGTLIHLEKSYVPYASFRNEYFKTQQLRILPVLLPGRTT